MNRTEQLRNAREVYTVAWREFLISEGRQPNAVFCFFEGEDNKFYIGRLKSLVDNGSVVKPLVCGGKSGVLRVNHLWSEKFSRPHSSPKCLFFLDRDFDCRSMLRLNGMAYLTPCYSIENLYVSLEAVGAVLENEFSVHTEERLEDCDALRFFERMLAEFLDASTLLNAWIFLHRKYEAMAPGGKRLNLKSVGFDRLFGVTRNGVSRLYSESDLPRLFPDAREIDAAELSRYADWLRVANRRVVFRGKYLVEFLRKTLEIIKLDRVSSTPQLFRRKSPVRLGLSRENIISELSQYAETPDCLKQFIRRATRLPLFEKL